ncbi:DDE-type integrase/transposase/recombinase [Rhizobium phaseoli]|uniref:DDE-type integrase/transposase/recombinase n=1 Tax=Rhizobium phaseoli TaxID=396 RepID=UPI0007E9DCF6|nr:DDE-type integrase/transposase/recombinase [Rhizobium phaseoli]ANL33893.1 ribonuclease H-like domain-containing protein [Rhizobium phaseoli]ANL97618.1 ribonuclease H-like domain-containing protein [Rhizobium phaseoli]
MDDMKPFTSSRLTIFDRVEMKGTAYRVRPSPEEYGYYLTEIGGERAVEFHSYAEIARRIRLRAIVIKRDFYTEEMARERKRKLIDPAIIPPHINYRARMLTKFLAEEAEGLRSRSDESILDFYKEYADEFKRCMPPARGGQKKVMIETHHMCTPRHFMRLLERFEAGRRSPFCLMYGGHPGDEKPTKRKLDARVNELLDAEARKIASSKQPDIALQWQLLNAENDASADRLPLPTSIRTFYRRVAEQKQMLLDLGRLGEETARDKNELSKSANRKYRALERIEMDEDKLDIIALLKGTRLWNVISPKYQAQIELLKDRFWASVAIDCGSRSILALRLLDSNPNGRSGVATLHMAVMPKDNFATAAGTETEWVQHGIPEEVATDHGGAYLDEDFQDTVLALCSSHLMPPLGTPRLRGRIERFFKTGKRWLRLFTGQTFSNPIARGAYESEANASMDFEELARCLVRLIVDCYHLTKHKGLDGQKPIDAWATMTKRRPVATLTDPEKEGLIFGMKVGTRTISRSGIVCLGIPYYSSEVQALFAHYKNKEVIIKANPYNLGLLGFRTVADDGFFWVKAAIPGFDGVSAIEWVTTKRLLDASYSQHDIQDMKVIRAALRQIMSTAKFSEDKHSVASHIVTKDDYDTFEKQVFNGYVAGNRVTPDYNPDPQLYLVDNLPEEDIEEDAKSEISANFEAEDSSVDPSSIVGPSEGTFDPDEFASRRAEDGVPEPLSTPPAVKDKKPGKKKEPPQQRKVGVEDLLRGTRFPPAAGPPGKTRKAGRPPIFKSDWKDEE